MIFEEHWEEFPEEELDGFKIGEFVGDPGWDWDLKVIWPCVITNILDNGKIEICECFSHKFGNRQLTSCGYRTRYPKEVKRWNEKTQIKHYLELKKRSKFNFTTQYKEWFDFVNEYKNYEI